MNRKTTEEIEDKTSEAILEQMKALAASYTPEWEFTMENPDAGSVLAMIFARQMERNIREACGAPDRFRLELTNMLGLACRPPVPAKSTVVMELNSAAVEGTAVAAGTRLLADGADGNKLVFRTCGDLYAVNVRLTHMIGISGRCQKAVPYWGDGIKPGPVKLFDFSEEGIWKSGVLLCHRTILDTKDARIYLKISGCSPDKEEAGQLCDPEYFEFYYSGGNGFVRADTPVYDNGIITVFLGESAGKQKYGDSEYGMIYIKTKRPVADSVIFRSVRLSAEGREAACEFLSRRDMEVHGERIFPFGEKIELYDEFYIGSSQVFGKAGAIVLLEFELEFEERCYRYEAAAPQPDLRPVKRKPRYISREIICRTGAEEVAVEYYNGTGWRKVPVDRDLGGLFDGSLTGLVKLSFCCPENWEKTAEGGYEGMILRIRVVRADNCYQLPCIHKLPVISAIKLSYSWEKRWEAPDRIVVCSGTKQQEVKPGSSFTAFAPVPYSGEYVFFGFEGCFAGGPVRMLLDIRQEGSPEPGKIRYEYSSKDGFSRLLVADHTEGLSGSGTISFLPPRDMVKTEVLGIKKYWIRMEDTEGRFRPEGCRLPVLKELLMNAAEVENVETGPEEEFYLDGTTAGEEVHLGNQPVLDALVFVNERAILSASETEQLLLEAPDKVRVEYGYSGEITACFVRWEEVESFRNSGPEDRHYVLDRSRRILKFGNGVRGKSVGEKNGTAYTVEVRCCDGEAGNVPENTISAPEHNLLFIGSIRNPFPACGGGNQESRRQLCARGTNRISSFGRLVSGLDYIREILSYSNHIVCASYGGRRDRRVSFILLMRDYQDGSASFNRIKGPLKEHLQKSCDSFLQESNLIFMEPVFIQISVQVWIRVKQTEEPFAVLQKLLDSIRDFIEPVPEGRKKGWKIGSFPQLNQITAMLHSCGPLGYVAYVTANAAYHDGKGIHEMDLEDLGERPFAIGVNGDHRVHFMHPKEGGHTHDI